jgi:hypothetical protein
MLEEVHDLHRSQDLYKQVIASMERNSENDTENIPTCHRYA